MDPYLEKHWADVHGALIGYIRDTLQPQLSDDLVARMEENVYVGADDGRWLRRPDVHVAEFPAREQSGGGGTAVAEEVALDEPLLLEPLGDPIRERNVLIYDSAGNRIVTAIEVLSPWNKAPGKAVEAYLAKREKYVNGEMNLVEIDLVRAGDWTSMIGAFVIPKAARTAYRVTVVQPGVSGPYLYPIPLRAKLPTIKVPLRPQDAPAKLNLQELVEKAYAMGRYDRINYGEACVPAFEGAEREWVEQVVRGAGR
jgi:hypothetical protein